jgi:hypothetical protein
MPTTAGHGTQTGHGAALCGGKTRSGGTCAKPAGWGTGHLGSGRCCHHAGATPSHELAAAVDTARREAIVMGEPVNVEPHELIISCIRRTAGEIAYCDEQIATLKTAMVSTMFGPQLHTWITVRHKAMERGVMFAATALKAGVEERAVRVAEQAGETMARLVRGILGELGVPLEDPRTREVVVRHLRLIEAGQQAA